MKRIKNIDEIDCSIMLLEEIDKEIMEEIVKYEDKIFGEGSIGIWNIKPFVKYGRVYILLSNKLIESRIVSVIEIIKGFEDNKAYIYGFFTNEKYRGRGISNLFLSNIIEEIAKNNMIEEIELTVSPENIQAIKLYEKNGFVVDQLLHNEYGEGEDRYLMYKKL